MKDSKLFPCYSIPMRDFLTKKGLKYELVGLHPKTQDMFWVYIKDYKLIQAIPDGNISSTLSNGRHYSCGYVWFYKKDYYDGCFNDIDCSALKFNQPIVQYDINGRLIEKYSNIPDAAKVLGVNNYSIYRVAIGERKSIKGFTYKFLN